MLQPQLFTRADLLGCAWRAASQAQVGCEKFSRAQQHAVVQACAEITDGRAGGDGDQQGEKQHTQLACAGIAQQLTASERKQAGKWQLFHQGSTWSTR